MNLYLRCLRKMTTEEEESESTRRYIECARDDMNDVLYIHVVYPLNTPPTEWKERRRRKQNDERKGEKKNKKKKPWVI